MSYKPKGQEAPTTTRRMTGEGKEESIRVFVPTANYTLLTFTKNIYCKQIYVVIQQCYYKKNCKKTQPTNKILQQHIIFNRLQKLYCLLCITVDYYYYYEVMLNCNFVCNHGTV